MPTFKKFHFIFAFSWEIVKNQFRLKKLLTSIKNCCKVWLKNTKMMSLEDKLISFNRMKRSLMLCMCYTILFEFLINIIWWFSCICRDQCADEDFRNFLMSLSDGFATVLRNVFNCERFSTELLLNSRKHHIRMRLEVMKLLLNSPVASKEWYLNHENQQRNIFHHLFFVCIPKGK